MSNRVIINRTYLPNDIQLTNWESVAIYFEELKNRELKSKSDLEKWMIDRSELESFIQEDFGWRYINMTCDATNKELTESFDYFVNEIDPKIAPYSNEFNLKLVQSSFLKELDKDKYFVYLRSVEMAIQLFREENIPLHAQLQTLQNNYGSITAAMTIEHDGKELTLQQAAKYYKSTDRSEREAIYHKISSRRIQDKEQLNTLYTELIQLRNTLAKNAGFDNYRDYKFAELNRFDYTKEDCLNLHTSVAKYLKPIVESFDKERKAKLNVAQLRPWDLDVDLDGGSPPKPFEKGSELIDKTIACFDLIDKDFSNYITTMRDRQYLDVESRKGKAPGGYNYPLYESNIPFIFMNAVGTMQDVETMVHEGGHAIHSFLSKNLELSDFKNVPSEVAELASMSMELISMEHWHVFLKEKEELKKAKIEQLQSSLKTLTWVCTIDKFQHWIYTHPTHTEQERTQEWLRIFDEFNSNVVAWDSLEENKANNWQKQLHLYEVPFYYIEYGMAQLGAIAMWRNYIQNPTKTIEQYKAALTLGYTKTIPEIYKTAGIQFNFSEAYIKELAEFITNELKKLEA